MRFDESEILAAIERAGSDDPIAVHFAAVATRTECDNREPLSFDDVRVLLRRMRKHE